MPPRRRAGARWRLLVHGDERRVGRELFYESSHHVQSDRDFGELPLSKEGRARLEEMREAAGATTTVLDGTVFDELVVGSWIHVEQMSGYARGDWWMNVGGVTRLVAVDRDGRPRHVAVFGPGDYGEERPGCTYDLHWSERVERARPMRWRWLHRLFGCPFGDSEEAL